MRGVDPGLRPESQEVVIPVKTDKNAGQGMEFLSSDLGRLVVVG